MSACAQQLPPVADGVSLHFVDDAAVLFSSHRQEVYAVNEPAAFIWCGLEEKFDFADLILAYSQSFGVSVKLAKIHVRQLVQKYENLGLLGGGLQHTASADQLWLPENHEISWLGSHTSVRLQASVHNERYYRLLSTCFQLRYRTADQERRIHPVLAHLETLNPGIWCSTVDLVKDDKRELVLFDGDYRAHCDSIFELAPNIKYALLAEAVNRFRYFLYIHAGVVRGAAGYVLMPGAEGRGKTSLTAMLLRFGFHYGSDEVALLEEDTLQARPVPVSLCIKDSAWDLLAPYYPDLAKLAVHQRPDGKLVRYLTPPLDAVEPQPQLSYPVTKIVFPEYSPKARTVLYPIKRTEALTRLLAECLVIPAPLRRDRVDQLVNWIRDIPCFVLSLSSLSEAAELLCQLDRGT